MSFKYSTSFKEECTPSEDDSTFNFVSDYDFPDELEIDTEDYSSAPIPVGPLVDGFVPSAPPRYAHLLYSDDSTARQKEVALSFWRQFYAAGNMDSVTRGDFDAPITKTEARGIVANQRGVAAHQIGDEDSALLHIVGRSSRQLQQYLVSLFDEHMDALEEKSETPRQILHLYDDRQSQKHATDVLAEMGIAVDFATDVLGIGGDTVDDGEKRREDSRDFECDAKSQSAPREFQCHSVSCDGGSAISLSPLSSSEAYTMDESISPELVNDASLHFGYSKYDLDADGGVSMISGTDDDCLKRLRFTPLNSGMAAAMLTATSSSRKSSRRSSLFGPSSRRSSACMLPTIKDETEDDCTDYDLDDDGDFVFCEDCKTEEPWNFSDCDFAYYNDEDTVKDDWHLSATAHVSAAATRSPVPGMTRSATYNVLVDLTRVKSRKKSRAVLREYYSSDELSPFSRSLALKYSGAGFCSSSEDEEEKESPAFGKRRVTSVLSRKRLPPVRSHRRHTSRSKLIRTTQSQRRVQWRRNQLSFFEPIAASSGCEKMKSTLTELKSAGLRSGMTTPDGRLSKMGIDVLASAVRFPGYS